LSGIDRICKLVNATDMDRVVCAVALVAGVLKNSSAAMGVLDLGGGSVQITFLLQVSLRFSLFVCVCDQYCHTCTVA